MAARVGVSVAATKVVGVCGPGPGESVQVFVVVAALLLLLENPLSLLVPSSRRSQGWGIQVYLSGLDARGSGVLVVVGLAALVECAATLQRGLLRKVPAMPAAEADQHCGDPMVLMPSLRRTRPPLLILVFST